VRTKILFTLLVLGLFPVAASAQDVCDVTEGTFNGESWSLPTGWAWRNDGWAYPWSRGDRYRFVQGVVYVHQAGVWKQWNGYGIGWSVVPEPSCVGVAPTPPSSSNDACDTTDITLPDNTRWFVSGGQAFVTHPEWGVNWHTGAGDAYRYLDHIMYLKQGSRWSQWASSGGWVSATPAPCPVSANSTVVKFAYWNMYEGAGKKSVTGQCFDRFGNPVAEAPNTSPGLQFPAGWALEGSGRPMYDALTVLAGDPQVVALGAGEAPFPRQVMTVLGWYGLSQGRPQVSTVSVFHDYILAKYGFLDEDRLDVGGTWWNIPLQFSPFTMNYANVCLDPACERTMPFFATHFQASARWGEGGNYDEEFRPALSWINEKSGGANAPRVLAGDLNAWDPAVDLHLERCIGPAPYEPGQKHIEGIRRIRYNEGYSDAWIDVHGAAQPAHTRYTGTINRGDLHYQACMADAGLPLGRGHKRMDYVFTKGIRTHESAEFVGAPFGPGGAGTVGWGNCVASDHLGVKVGFVAP